MVSKNNLDFAEKYNWWTKDKSSISDETKISYILCHGKLDELFFVFKNFPEETIKKAYLLVKNDNFKLKERRKSIIENFLNHKYFI